MGVSEKGKYLLSIVFFWGGGYDEKKPNTYTYLYLAKHFLQRYIFSDSK